MKRKFAFAILAAFLVAQPIRADELVQAHAFTGVSWDADKSPISNLAPLAGLHYAPDGRAFISAPRWISPEVPATLNVLTDDGSGIARLVPFPAEGQGVATDPATSLRNVLGFHVDATNNWLWALDMGFAAGEAEAPAGGQKIVIYDLATGAVVRRVPLDEVADRKGSFLNDIAVDEARRRAFVSDSGFRSAPDNMTGIITYDFALGAVSRVLDRDPSVQVDAKAPVTAHGKPVWEGAPLMIGINGIALSPDGAVLYWTVTTGDSLYAAPVAALTDPALSDAQRSAQVRRVAELGFSTDGILVARDGAVLITNVSNNGIARVDPASGAVTMLADDDAIHWPDTVTLTPDGAIAFTASNTSDHFAGIVAPGDERYGIWRIDPMK